MNKLTQLVSASLIALMALTAHAEVTFQGFASFVGGATLDEDDTSYVGYDNKLEFDKNSLYALQASANLGDGLSATAQIISRGSENYKPEMEWMYLSYNLTPTLNAKMGRIRTPFYMFSEYLEVGYTYHWIRPPVEVYAAQVTNMDGISFLYNMPLGSVDSQYQVVIGARKNFTDDPTATVADYQPLVGINAQFEVANYTAKLIYSQGDIDFNNTQTTNLYSNTAALDTAFADKYAVFNNTTIVFAGAGIEMNFHPLKVHLEMANIDVDKSLLGTDESRLLASFAYNIGNNTFHYSYSSNTKEGHDELLNEASGNAFLQGLITATIAGSESEVTTHTIGVRHDFHDSAAFKTEYIMTEDDKQNTEATVLRFGVDMLF